MTAHQDRLAVLAHEQRDFEKYQQFNFRLLYWERQSGNFKRPCLPGWNDPNRGCDLSQYDPAKHNVGFFSGLEIEPGRFLIDIDFDWAPGGGALERHPARDQLW